MRIVVDIQGMQNGSRFRGIGRCTSALSRALARNRDQHEIFVMVNGLLTDSVDYLYEEFAGLIPKSNFLHFSCAGPVDELAHENHWRTRAGEYAYQKFVSEISPDLLLLMSLFEGGCDNTISTLGRLAAHVPTAVILHDLIPLIDPEKYIGPEANRTWYHRKLDSLRYADQLFAVSKSARQEAIDHLNVDPSKIAVISEGSNLSNGNLQLDPRAVEDILARYGITRPFLMHSSSVEERKNFDGLIRAFARLPNNLRGKYQLVLVGKMDGHWNNLLNNAIRDCGLGENEVILTNFVSDHDLITLYSRCSLFVFPSFHEGFGLPALEAMNFGVPTIGSNRSSIPEVIGREDALFDPASTEDMAAVIARALEDPIFYASLKAHAPIQAKKFSWDIGAQVILEEAAACLAQRKKMRATSGDRLHEFVQAVAAIDTAVRPSDGDLLALARAVDANELEAKRFHRLVSQSTTLEWRIEGPFDSSYSLALVNRELARALTGLGHKVSLHSTEGPGDFDPDPTFLELNPDLKAMNARASAHPQDMVDVASRNLYPPRVEDMVAPQNLLHSYAWEESGFPRVWAESFNAHLQGILCTSAHVRKVLEDAGITVPMAVVGNGVDHVERIRPALDYQVTGRKFRFLHISSCFPRKGADVLLDAWGRAFSNDDDVSLIIKTFPNPHNNVHAWLSEAKRNRPNYPDVVIIEQDLTEAELKALYQSCHVFVAPSRAEGFGLPMAEAFLNGLPVITTGWSGQMDFCDSSNSWLVDFHFERAVSHFNLHNSVWANPLPNSLTLALQSAYSADRSSRATMARRGRERILSNFTWRHVAERSLQAVLNWRSVESDRPQLRLGWMSTWNTKCGIATYSEHLLENFPNDYLAILAARQDTLVRPDEQSVFRCWNARKDDNDLNEAARIVAQHNLNCIVIQFNYSFFNFQELPRFIEHLIESDIAVVVDLHSTCDPYGDEDKNWCLATLAQALGRCNRVLAHSVGDLNRLKAIGVIGNVVLFPHGVRKVDVIPPRRLTKTDVPVIASYGFCLPHKGLDKLVLAAALLKQRGRPIKLLMVNAEYPADISLQIIDTIRETIVSRGLTDDVTMDNRFLNDSESLSLLQNSDMVVYAYQGTGESASGAVRYGMTVGRPVAVTPLEIFSDLGDAVFRLPGVTPEDLANGIAACLDSIIDGSILDSQMNKAARWVDDHDYAAISSQLSRICRTMVRQITTDQGH
jgi:glycosyltransferase involved in cell wall biosynthesis